MATRKAPQSSQSSEGKFLKLCTSVVKELGLPSFLVIIAVCIFVWYGTQEQKEEFINRFILLKDASNDPYPSFLVVGLLIFVYVITFGYQHSRIKAQEKEIKRISEERTALQEALLKKSLKSSK